MRYPSKTNNRHWGGGYFLITFNVLADSTIINGIYSKYRNNSWFSKVLKNIKTTICIIASAIIKINICFFIALKFKA